MQRKLDCEASPNVCSQLYIPRTYASNGQQQHSAYDAQPAVTAAVPNAATALQLASTATAPQYSSKATATQYASAPKAPVYAGTATARYSHVLANR